MKNWPLDQRVREWLIAAGAVAIGPIFLGVGYAANLMFGLAAAAFLWVCAVVVPLLTYASGRLKFLVWQLAVLSLVLSDVGDNLRLHAIQGQEILAVAFGSWTLGTLISSPLPIYMLMRPLEKRQRIIVGLIIAVAALALYVGAGLIIEATRHSATR